MKYWFFIILFVMVLLSGDEIEIKVDNLIKLSNTGLNTWLFEKIQGSIEAPVQFIGRSAGLNLLLSPDIMIFSDCSEELCKIHLIDANPNVRIIPSEATGYKRNYIIGRDPESWQIGIPTYRKLNFREIYSKIDLKVYSNSEGELEYDFILKPGADLSLVKLRFEPVNQLKIDRDGELFIQPGQGKIMHWKSKIYQETPTGVKVLAGGFVQLNKYEVGFAVDDYDSTYPLVLDPVLSFSSYLGGGNSDFGKGIALDKQGNIYVTGTTRSLNFPVNQPIREKNAGDFDVFVTKIDAHTLQPIFSTYLGGNDVDSGNSIAVDDSGNIYIAGHTGSIDFPLQGALQSTHGGGNFDAFITKINPAGTKLIYSTYLGGKMDEIAEAIAVDLSGNAHVTGTTSSMDFPTRNAVQMNYGGGLSDAFITKINPTGSGLVYSTYFGDNGNDVGTSLIVNNQGLALVTGANSNGQNGGLDAFVLGLSADGQTIETGFQVGTDSNDLAQDIATDEDNNIYLTGMTAIGPMGGDDVFVLKLNNDGSQVLYGNFLGGSGKEVGNALAVTKSGDVVVVGRTGSFDFPTVDAFQAEAAGGLDGFVARFNAQGQVVFASYLGGSGGDIIAETGDNCADLALDEDGNIYIAGHTLSKDFPRIEPFQDTYGGGDADAFVVKISPFATYVSSRSAKQAKGFYLEQNYPNPFNPKTTIRFTLPQAAWVTLKVFDRLGKEVTTLMDQFLDSGEHQVAFDATSLASGIYFYRLQAGRFVQQKRMVYLK